VNLALVGVWTLGLTGVASVLRVLGSDHRGSARSWPWAAVALASVLGCLALAISTGWLQYV
jgi:hypothetical protein